jgi:hypothetical protein
MTRITLSGSVGLGGKNLATDIKTIQHALNQLPSGLPTTPKLAVDGQLSEQKNPT